MSEMCECGHPMAMHGLLGCLTKDRPLYCWCRRIVKPFGVDDRAAAGPAPETADHPFNEECHAGCAPGTHAMCRQDGCYRTAAEHQARGAGEA